jgi:hypothetical protein
LSLELLCCLWFTQMIDTHGSTGSQDIATQGPNLRAQG